MEEKTINPEFSECLKRNKIREFSQGKPLVSKEIAASENDLLEAKKSFQEEADLNGQPFRLIIQSLRENADYYDQWSGIGTREMLGLAEEFLDKAKTIISNI